MTVHSNPILSDSAHSADSTLERLRDQDAMLARTHPGMVRPSFDERLSVYRGFLKISALFVAHIAVILLLLAYLYI